MSIMRSKDIKCGLSGNGTADELAKPGAKGRQHDNSVTFQEKKTLIRAALGQCTERDDFHFLDRWQAGCGHETRLRTGHNRLKAHMLRKMKLAPSPTCSCGLEDQTAEHLLLQTGRTNVWPTAVQLHTKLYGSKKELEKTATFILQTRHSVQRRLRIISPTTTLANNRFCVSFSVFKAWHRSTTNKTKKKKNLRRRRGQGRER